MIYSNKNILATIYLNFLAFLLRNLDVDASVCFDLVDVRPSLAYQMFVYLVVDLDDCSGTGFDQFVH